MYAVQWMVDHQIMTLITLVLVAHPSFREKAEVCPQCAMHADFNITLWSTTYENIICFDCDAPHTTITMSRAQAKSQNVFTFFLHITYVIRGPLLGKYQHCITTGQSSILPLGSPLSHAGVQKIIIMYQRWSYMSSFNLKHITNGVCYAQCTCTCYLHTDKSKSVPIRTERCSEWLQTFMINMSCKVPLKTKKHTYQHVTVTANGKITSSRVMLSGKSSCKY